jgi:hypothetical protein
VASHALGGYLDVACILLNLHETIHRG